MKLLLTFLTFLLTNEVLGNDGSLKFLERNQKLNRNYLSDLNDNSSNLYFSGNPETLKNISRNREKLNIYPVRLEGDQRLINPDAIEVRFEYKKFNMGDLILNILKPVYQGNVQVK